MSIIIFNNNTDFIKTLDQLKDYVNNKDKFIYLTIQLNDLSDVYNEIEFIRKQHLLTFNGFRSQTKIIVALQSSYGLKVNIRYTFKRNSLMLYDTLHHNLRLIEWR